MTAYTDTLQVARLSGLGKDIVNESLGTGDNAEDSYDLNNGNVIAESYTISYGVVGDNSLTALTETTHYSLDKDAGTVLLTGAGITLVNTKAIYASYTHSPKVSNTVLQSYLASVNDQVDNLTGNYWGVVKSDTEIFDRNFQNYPNTDRPYIARDSTTQETFQLKYKGLNSISGAYLLSLGEGIANAQVYDSVAVSYSDVTDEVNSRQSGSFFPFADTPAVGDYLYIGISQKFHSLHMLMDIAGVQSAATDNTIEYYNGTTWAAVTVDNAPNFTSDIKSSWNYLSGWAKTTVNSSQSYYFIRIKAAVTYNTVPKVAMIYPGAEFIIGQELELSRISYQTWGAVNFEESVLQNGKYKLRIDYTHGYSTIPNQIQELAALVAAKMSLVRVSGGSFSDISTYTLGRKTFSIGQVYVNVREAINQMDGRIKDILTNVGRKMDVV